MKRVLMTTDAVGGVWTYALELCRSLGAHDVEVLLAAMGPAPSPAQRAAVGRLSNVTLEHRPFALEWMPSPWTDVQRAGDWLLELEAEFEPDVCHINGYAHGACNFSVPVVVVAHSCVCSWWRAVHKNDAGLEWHAYRQTVRAGLDCADAIVAPTRWMKDQLSLHYPGARAEVAVIANARSAKEYRPGPKEPFVFAAGRVWDEAKNLRLLDKLGAVPWETVIAGASRETFGRCRLLGQLAPEEVASWLARAAVYVLPAKYEPFGLSVVEAALSGCALVLGDIPSLRETWDDAAIFVEPGDAVALKSAITTCFDRADLRRELVAKASVRAEQLTPERQAGAYLALYDAVTASRSSACVS